MSELFDDDPRTTPPAGQPPSRRSRAVITTAMVLVFGFFALTTFSSFYTDRLWYQSLGFGSVFTTMFLTRLTLFLVFGAVMALVVGVNIVLAYRLRPVFRPNSPEQTGLERYREAIGPIRTWLLIGIGGVLGVFAGTSGAGEWRSWMMWRNGGDFDRTDAYFNRDIGWYVFDLPFWHYLADFTMAMLVISIVAAGVVHYLYGGIRLQTPRDKMSGAAQAQLSLLLGLFVLAKAADYWLDRYDLVNDTGSLITGMTFTDENAVLPAKNILMGVAVICAVLFFLNVWRRTWLLPSVGLALLALSAVLLGAIWPGIVQQFQVKPSEADKEESYIAANIEATRSAYDVQDVEPVSYASNANIDEVRPSALLNQVSSVPLVDPQLVRETFDQQQQARAYYSVADVLDVDRYEIDGKDRALVLGVRELDQEGINASDRNWSNLHTVYTHGNGVIAAFANQRGVQNGPEATEIKWAEVGRSDGGVSNELAKLSPDGTYEDRVYFGEKSPDYSVVGRPEGSAAVELDLGGTDEDGEVNERTTTYDGKGGVEVGSSFRQLLYAIRFGEPNFILSGRVNDSSSVLYNRTPRERVEKVAPWLTMDSDPYPVLVDGKITWVLDGYTTTDRYPLAERESFRTMTDDALQDNTGLRTLPTDEINYMRNAVKATVDAYDGTVTLYAWDETDPLLAAWRAAFPGTVQDREDIPSDLLEHLRYPEDLFKVQRYQYARYHVTDPGDWYQGNNRWEVPEDPNANGSLQPPYRIFLNDPEEPGDDVWSLTSVFVPYGRGNLASFVSVNSDATSPDYGKIQVLELQSSQTPGPGLIANELSNDQDVRDRLLAFQSGQSPPVFGNLLTLPVADGLIYVEPVYAVRAGSSGGYPELTFVLVSYGDGVGIGSTLGDAIAMALGVDEIDKPTTGGTGNNNGNEEPGSETDGTVNERIRAALARADRAFAAADEALSAGDLAEYERQIEAAQNAVDTAVSLANARDNEAAAGGGAGAGGDATASPEPTPTDPATQEPTDGG